ncbi:hypothetical protein [Altererythrobacter sp. ZODW24]|uniref:hypothetical protein n=1 Tax=Altererythrobacter sp. ZODW24 TaxID=2185142 RepID=UPI000DF80EE4|nr:hypothetical protein [Altererythrobacter sp. ZODW24]
MIDARPIQTTEQPVEDLLQRELALGDVVLGTVGPILGHLLANDDHSLFSDEIVARIRGMIASCARQLALAQEDAAQTDLGEAADAVETSEFSKVKMAKLAESLTANPAFLTHCHALAVEWHLAERLQARNAIDPVLSPLVQALIASPDAATATNAMSYLAAQARFVQHQRRMELPLTELPGDLFHTAVLTLAAHAEEGGEDATSKAEARLRNNFDEGKSRLGLLSRLIIAMGSGAKAALSVSHAGPSVFMTALAVASNQQRELTVISTNDRQLARLALAMRAAGLKPEAVEEQFALIHPEIVLPEGFEALRSDRAAALLASSSSGLLD